MRAVSVSLKALSEDYLKELIQLIIELISSTNSNILDVRSFRRKDATLVTKI